MTAETTPPPISGGTLAVSDDGTTVVAADPDRDSVYVINPVTTAFQVVLVDKGSEPGRVVLDDEGRAHVALRNKGGIVSIDLATSKVLLQTTLCSHPRGMAFDRENAAILVACANGELVSISTAKHRELSRVFVDHDLRDVVVTRSGARFVSRYRSAELILVSADGKVQLRTEPRTGQAPRQFRSKGPPPSEGRQFSLAMSPTLAWRTIAGADGAPLMVHQQSQDDEVVILQAGGYGGGTNPCAAITRPAVTRYDENGTPSDGWPISANGSLVDVAQSRDGEWMAFAQPGAYLHGAGSVSVLKVRETSLPRPIPVDDSDGGVVSSISCPLLNAAFGSSLQATSVVFDAQGKLYAFSREPAQLSVFANVLAESGGSPSGEILALPLSTTSVRDTGHELFHTDVGTGLACTSCHGEALDDGHVWSFQGFGPRRTQNIRGGMLGTLPLHWEGDLSTFPTLVNEVMTRRMGGFVVEARYADALARWIDKTPAFKLEPSHTPGADAAVARGKALFESAEVACASCHNGAMLTNNQTVDVGTGGRFQVPSLLGLALRSPFMHDGCAKTLLGRFDAACGGSNHGTTAQLSEPQLLDLVRYLETL